MQRLVFLSVIGGLGLAALLSLGIWQMQRLAWKEAVLDQIETRIAADPVALPADVNEARDKYLPVRLEGEILPGELHVFTSIKDLGAGYRIIAPFVTSDGRRVMLDRGYVPASAKTKARPIGAAALVGNLHWPDDTDDFTPAPELEANIWYSRDVAQMAEALNSAPVLLVLREAPPEHSAIRLMPVGTALIPNDHLQYAITWFSLAFIWAAMTASFLWRSNAKSEG
ncbi:SURF1 family protein [Pseudophaeobacter flagellatus]|uniref:SURF1 family protein n=1 Tax=Pseudophaeobacter flagellatus TaxID=2899119 RepID=UPI001E37BDAD|nr:SURF1 family protein [Pseudophaeobacter flagellatus]MCD9148438.1 SURF1 family protein [Pseudophaeobacter flagellatus]